eukprot:COSAG01_NODE_316_length_19004_cov_100.001322_17_plen_95_part_00
MVWAAHPAAAKAVARQRRRPPRCFWTMVGVQEAEQILGGLLAWVAPMLASSPMATAQMATCEAMEWPASRAGSSPRLRRAPTCARDDEDEDQDH